jgi:hypothetical protein
MGKLGLKFFRVPPAVTQMQDHPGCRALHGLDHIGDISVRIGENQNLHYQMSLSGISILVYRIRWLDAIRCPADRKNKKSG